MELTDLEWEIIYVALKSPILNYLYTHLTTGELDYDHDVISDTWDSITEKFSETW